MARREFREGGAVRVQAGAFRGFAGVVVGEAAADDARVAVTVPVCGRQTVLALERVHLEKLR